MSGSKVSCGKKKVNFLCTKMCTLTTGSHCISSELIESGGRLAQLQWGAQAAVYGPFGVIYCGPSSQKIASANSIANYMAHSSRKKTRPSRRGALSATRNDDVSIQRMCSFGRPSICVQFYPHLSFPFEFMVEHGSRESKWAEAISHVLAAAGVRNL